ncbi:hypothetical protein L6164_021793 [Bauhinia variegata]|uniref:Uncharacterized protein n=1 Tax=Bauhinia variegata TaxID=167791 RepID=A0ACB9MGG4_BAUVA|nr:hypothetical protein L6164_021793 [Bauhinia variegata]
MPFLNEEQEERRMPDLSDWASSVTSTADIQRVAELEDIICRKNTTITKLKKDLGTLEQKIVHLSRLGRPSFSASDSDGGELLHSRDNILYDMESTTSASSSDSDTAPIPCSRFCGQV